MSPTAVERELGFVEFHCDAHGFLQTMRRRPGFSPSAERVRCGSSRFVADQGNSSRLLSRQARCCGCVGFRLIGAGVWREAGPDASSVPGSAFPWSDLARSGPKSRQRPTAVTVRSKVVPRHLY